MSKWGWIAQREVKSTRTCGTPIYRSRISNLRHLWLGAYVLLLCLEVAPKAKSGEKLHTHMVEILVSHSRWLVALLFDMMCIWELIQLVDDTLDYESTLATLGKPNNADLKLGLTTAPALYAWEEFPEMGQLIMHQFKSPGDPEKVNNSIFLPSLLFVWPATLSGSRAGFTLICNPTNSTTCTNLRWWSKECLARVTSQRGSRHAGSTCRPCYRSRKLT